MDTKRESYTGCPTVSRYEPHVPPATAGSKVSLPAPGSLHTAMTSARFFASIALFAVHTCLPLEVRTGQATLCLSTGTRTTPSTYTSRATYGTWAAPYLFSALNTTSLASSIVPITSTTMSMVGSSTIAVGHRARCKQSEAQLGPGCSPHGKASSKCGDGQPSARVRTHTHTHTHRHTHIHTPDRSDVSTVSGSIPKSLSRVQCGTLCALLATCARHACCQW
jgi:hypothetical protein